jgi:hypothetical protein
MFPLLLEAVLLESDPPLVTYTFSTFQQQPESQEALDSNKNGSVV